MNVWMRVNVGSLQPHECEDSTDQAAASSPSPDDRDRLRLADAVSPVLGLLIHLQGHPRSPQEGGVLRPSSRTGALKQYWSHLHLAQTYTDQRRAVHLPLEAVAERAACTHTNPISRRGHRESSSYTHQPNL